MNSNLLLPPLFTVLDSNGAPVSGAKIYTYETGTTTPKVTYSDSVLSVANANPIICDASGRPSASSSPILLYAATSEVFKIVIKTAADVEIATYDPVYIDERAESVNALISNASGLVRQRLFSTISSSYSTTSSSYTDTGLSATITPNSTTNIIRLQVIPGSAWALAFVATSGGEQDANAAMQLRVMAGGTIIGTDRIVAGFSGRTNAATPGAFSVNNSGAFTMEFIPDDYGLSGALNIKIQSRAVLNSGTGTVTSTITNGSASYPAQRSRLIVEEINA